MPVFGFLSVPAAFRYPGVLPTEPFALASAPPYGFAVSPFPGLSAVFSQAAVRRTAAINIEAKRTVRIQAPEIVTVIR